MVNPSNILQWVHKSVKLCIVLYTWVVMSIIMPCPSDFRSCTSDVQKHITHDHITMYQPTKATISRTNVQATVIVHLSNCMYFIHHYTHHYCPLMFSTCTCLHPLGTFSSSSGYTLSNIYIAINQDTMYLYNHITVFIRIEAAPRIIATLE